MKGTHKIVIGKYEDRRSPRTKKNEKRKKNTHKIIRLKKVEETRIQIIVVKY